MNYKDLEIRYEDNHILVFNKPSGILTHADKTADKSMAAYAEDYIRNTYNKPGKVFVGISWQCTPIESIKQFSTLVAIFVESLLLASELLGRLSWYCGPNAPNKKVLQFGRNT